MSFRFPYLRLEDIELHSETILGQSGFIAAIPVEIELLLEATFGYSVVYDETLPLGVDGAIEPERNCIRVSTHIDHLGRQRFTLAHELGHLILHIPHIQNYRIQAPLFKQIETPALLQNDSAEWQANMFASAILMPRQHMILKYGALANEGAWVDPRRVADEFQVSIKAAEIRLEILGINRKSSPEQKLFL